MWFQIGVLLVSIAFLIYLAAAFGGSLAQLLVNGTIIFLIAYRSYFEIKAGKQRAFMVGAGAAFIILLLFGNFGDPFWLFTTFLIVAYVFSLITLLLQKHLPAPRRAHGRLVRKA